MGCRIAVAVQAKRHVQRLYLLHFHHLVDSAVAADAADASRHVRLVIEKYEIGKAVNPHPLDRHAGGVAVAYFLQTWTLRLHASVAVHADFGGRYCRVAGLIYCVMTVVAVHAKVARMQFVTIGNGLRRLVTGHDDLGVPDVHREPGAAKRHHKDGCGPKFYVLVSRLGKD
jgi:hypothetical protein